MPQLQAVLSDLKDLIFQMTVLDRFVNVGFKTDTYRILVCHFESHLAKCTAQIDFLFRNGYIIEVKQLVQAYI